MFCLLACCASSEVFASCRAARDRRRSAWTRRPCAFNSIACDHLTRASTGHVGLGQLQRVSLRTLGRHHPDASPSSSRPRKWHHYNRRLRFGVIRSRPPCCARINRRTQRTTSATRLIFRTTGPTAVVRNIRTCVLRHRRPRGFLVRQPLLRFSSPATLTGCARAVRGGQPPDDPASAFPSFAHVGPRAFFSKRPADEMDFHHSPLRFSAGADSLR
jgi:hypothetical protein